MDLNYLLSRGGIDTKASRVLVMRHVPRERDLRRVLPWLAAERPDLFNAYQQSQGPKVETQLARADYLASFIGRKAGQALFVGLYKVAGKRNVTLDEFWQIPASVELQSLGMAGLDANRKRPSILWFDLAPTDVYSNWKGKLVITWPPPEIRWARWADHSEFGVKAILEESALVEAMPDWDKLSLT